MRIVVTGASGFTGKAVVSLLQGKGYKVCQVSRNHIEGMHYVADYLDTPGGDYLIHLAEIPDRQKVNALGKEYLQKTIDITTQLSKKFNGNVIYASSSLVYGDNHQSPCSEETDVYKTDWYTEVKLTNEQIVIEQGGIALRLANLFGIGMSTGNILSDIMGQLNTEGTVYVRNGFPVRDFLHIQEMANATLSLLGSSAGIFNVGSGQGLSIKELAQKALKITGQTSRKVVSRQVEQQNHQLVLDVSKIKKSTGWEMSQDINSQITQFISQKTNHESET